MRLKYENLGETPMEWHSGLYEFQHGVFIQGLRYSPDISHGQHEGVRIINLGRSRSAEAIHPTDKSIPTTVEYRLGFEFSEFNIDPEQNLAIYACVDDSEALDDGLYGLPLVKAFIRIRQLGGNGSLHPRARFEKLELGITFQRGLAFFIQIFGDFVGVLTRSISGLQLVRDTSEFVIYNWKTGVMQTVSF